jgi:23S rRNA pseudouridine1911/1915/1917 synthase
MTAREIKKPVKEKVNHQFKVEEPDTLLPFLLKRMSSKSRTEVKSFLRFRQVSVNGIIVAQFNHPLLPGDTIETGNTKIQVNDDSSGYTIVFEDNDLIVIDKKAGLLSIATASEKEVTAYSRLRDHVKKPDRSSKIFIVHRLDRDTSGLMLFAKKADVKHRLQDTWEDSVLLRSYIAVVEGEMNPPEGEIVSWLHEDKTFRMHSSQNPGPGQKSVTRYSTIKKNRDYSLLNVSLETGRKNQIRIQMQEAGHSIAGDKKYGAGTNPLKRLGLHARQLSFIHPVTGKHLNFETAIPRSFLRLF